MKTGDYKSLSAVDIKVMALTYQLEKEFVGSDHIKSVPEKKVCDHADPWICIYYMIYHQFFYNNNTMCACSGAGTAYHITAPKFIPGFLFGLCCSIFSFLCSAL